MEASDEENSEAHFIGPALAAARRNHVASYIMMGAFCSIIAILFMLISFLPTSYNWDPEMPDYSDPDAVVTATLTSGCTVFFAALGAALLWRWRMSVMLVSIILAIGIYRFITLLPHFVG